MREDYGFHLVCNKGKGYLASSWVTPIGDLVQGGSFGQAKLQSFINITTGQVYHEGFQTRVVERGYSFSIGLAFNTGLKAMWRLTVDKRFSGKLEKRPNDGTIYTLVEEDGSETIYRYDSKINFFIPFDDQHPNKPVMRYSESAQLWVLVFPETNDHEYYAENGLRLRRENAQGHGVDYDYNSNLELVKISGESGNSYEIKRSSGRLIISQTNGKILQDHQLITESDKKGLVACTQLADYMIYYDYNVRNDGYVLLQGIRQSDGSSLNFSYDLTFDDHIPRVNAINSEKQCCLSLSYNPRRAEVILWRKNNSDSKTTFRLDAQGRLQQREQAEKMISGDYQRALHSYAYDIKVGYVQAITYPDNTQETWKYDDTAMCRPSRRSYRNGAVDEYVYRQAVERCTDRICLIQREREGGVPRITRYAYDIKPRQDDLGKKTGLYYRALCFQINPTGRVQELIRANDLSQPGFGDVLGIRCYASFYQVSGLPPTTELSLGEMQQWAARQALTSTAYQRYTRDKFGSVWQTWYYRYVDAQGKGDDNAVDTGYVQDIHEFYGAVRASAERYDVNTHLETLSEYDDYLQRLQKVTTSDGAMTSFTLKPAEFFPDGSVQTKAALITTYPNQRQKSQTLDQYGQGAERQVQAKTIDGASELITEAVIKAADGQVLVNIRADGTRAYQAFDGLSRLTYSINSKGYVKQNSFDDTKRLIKTTQYAQAITLTPDYVPTVHNLLQQLKDKQQDENNRCSYQLLNAKGQSLFTVDEEGFVIQCVYDNFNREIQHIAYADRLIPAQLEQVAQGIAPSLIYDASKDGGTQKFYDADDYVIAEQDGEGFVTEYRRNGLGKVAERIHYATRSSWTRNWNALIPAKDKDDAHHYFFYNLQKEVVAEVDAENYLTTYAYFGFGKVKQKIQYATRLADDWQAHFGQQTPIPPAANGEDIIFNYEYDRKKREVRCDRCAYALTADDKVDVNQTLLLVRKETHYDVMGNVLQEEVQDGLALAQQDPDHYRTTLAQFDGFDRSARTANPNVGKLLFEASGIESKEEIWRQQSHRTLFSKAGLPVKITDENGFNTYYYYDQDHELRYLVKERKLKEGDEKVGVIISYANNIFSEREIERHYVKTLGLADIPQVEDGLLTDAAESLLDSLQTPEEDAHFHFTYDKRSIIKEIIDPEGYVTRQRANAFHEIEHEEHCISAKEPSVMIDRQFDRRGGSRIRQEKTTAGTKTKKESWQFENPHGKVSQHVNVFGAEENFRYERRGFSLWHQSVSLQAEESWVVDAAGRNISHTNFLGKKTAFEYKQQAREKRVIPPLIMTTKTYRTNAFKQVIEEQDALHRPELKNTRRYTHTPAGKIQTECDQLDHEKSWVFDLADYPTDFTDAGERHDHQTHDGAGGLLQKVEDVAGITRRNKIERDALGNARVLTDAMDHVVVQGFNRKQQLTDRIRDPEGLALQTHHEVNANGNPVRTEIKSVERGVESAVQNKHDEFGFVETSIKDPEQLKVTDQQLHDVNGKVIAEIDGAGNRKRTFYNSDGLKRFVLQADGSLVEFHYNALKNITLYRECENRVINSDKIVTLEDLEKVAPTIYTENDKQLLHLYDDDQREVFSVNAQGSIQERVLNICNEVIEHKSYATALGNHELATLSTEMVREFVDSHQDVHDRSTYFIRDAKGRERFSLVYGVDASGKVQGYLSEQRFDAKDNVLAKIIYATPLNGDQIKSLKMLSEDQVYAYLKQAACLDPLHDRMTVQVFNTFSQLLFLIQPGSVPKVHGSTYYQDGMPESDCDFAVRQDFTTFNTDPDYYRTYQAVALSLNFDLARDRKKAYCYDAAKRKINVREFSAGEPDGLLSVYSYNVVDLPLTQQNPLGHVQTDIYDAALRKTDSLSAAVDLYTIAYEAGKLVFSKRQQQPLQHTDYDLASNPYALSIGAHDQKTLCKALAEYDACRRPFKRSVAEAMVDNPARVADFDNRPDQPKIVSVTEIYNGKQLTIGRCDEGELWTFSIYNGDNKERYEVLPNRSLIEYRYNAFSEIVEVIHYVELLDINLSDYAITGIPLAVIEAHKKISSQDRHRIIERDFRGDIARVEDGEVWYTDIRERATKRVKDTSVIENPPEGDFQFPILRKAKKEIYYKRNAFSDVIRQFRLIAPATSTEEAHYAETLTWVNTYGDTLASLSASGQLIRYTLNEFSDHEERYEYAHSFKNTAEFSTLDINALDAYLEQHKSDKDCHYKMTYNQYGLKETETLLAQESYQINRSGGHPVIEAAPCQDKSTHYFYDNNKNQIAKQDALGRCEFFFYNARGDLIFEMGIPFSTTNAEGESVLMIPLTEHGYDERGKRIFSCRYRWGAAEIIDPRVSSALPQAKQIDAEHDQINLSLLDARGNSLLVQDANGHLKGMSYTAQGQKARHWLTVTGWQDQLNLTSRVDEFIKTRDELQHVILDVINRVQQGQRSFFDKTQYFFNTFGEDLGQANADASDFPRHLLRRGLDGMVLFDNDRNKQRLMFRDLLGRVVVIVESRTLDLSEVTPEKFNELLQLVKDQNDLMVSWITLDDDGAEVLRESPQSLVAHDGAALLKAGIDPKLNLPLIPIDIFTHVSYAVSDNQEVPAFYWPLPLQTSVTAKTIKLWSVAATEAEAVELPITTRNRCYWVDVSMLPNGAGLYHFQVLYALQENSEIPTYLYQSRGTIPVIAPQVEHSVTPVIYVENDCVARVTGKTTNISSIDLYQDARAEQKVATVPVNLDPATGLLSADLSTLVSGIYYFRPTGESNLALLSAAQTVTTTQLPATPFSQVIALSDVKVWHLDNHLQIDWKITERFKNNSMRVNLVLHHELGDHNEAFSVEFLVDPTKAPTQYIDKNGRILLSNAELEEGDAIRSILSLTMTVITEDQREIAVLNKAAPLLLGATIDSENIIRGIAFDPRLTLYYSGLALTPKSNAVSLENDIILEYAPYQNSDLIKWIHLISVGVTGNDGAFFDVTQFEPGHYLARIADVDLPPFMRGACIVMSDDASTQSYVVVRSHYVREYDAWHNPIKLKNPEQIVAEERTYDGSKQIFSVLTPPVPITASDGKTTEMRLLTRYPRDISGTSLGVILPSGEQTVYDQNEASLTRALYEPGETKPTRQVHFDALALPNRELDSRNKITTQIFSGDGRHALKTILPSGRYIAHEINEQGAVITENTNGKWIIRHAYDPRVYVERSILPGGQVTQMLRQRHGKITWQKDSMNGEIRNTYDTFGILHEHTNRVGSRFVSSYDFYGSLIEEKQISGEPCGYRIIQQSRYMSAEQLALLYSQVSWFSSLSALAGLFNFVNEKPVGQHIHYKYRPAFDVPVRIFDLAQGSLTLRLLDLLGRTVDEQDYTTTQETLSSPTGVEWSLASHRRSEFNQVNGLLYFFDSMVYGKLLRDIDGNHRATLLDVYFDGRAGYDLLVTETVPTPGHVPAIPFSTGNSAYVLVRPNSDSAPTDLYFVDRLNATPTVKKLAFVENYTMATFLQRFYSITIGHLYLDHLNLSNADLDAITTMTGHVRGTQHQESWFDCNAAGRVTKADCLLVDGVIQLNAAEKRGSLFGYEVDFRVWQQDYNLLKDNLRYDDDSRLIGSDNPASAFVYDDRDHITSCMEGAKTSGYSFGANGELQKYSFTDKKTTNIYFSNNNLGLPTHMSAHYPTDKADVIDELDYDYSANGVNDNLFLRRLGGTRKNPQGDVSGYQQARQSQGPNGELIARFGVEEGANHDPATIYYKMVNSRLIEQQSVFRLNSGFSSNFFPYPDQKTTRPFYAGSDVVATYEHQLNSNGSIKNAVGFTQYMSSAVGESALKGGGTIVVSPELLGSASPSKSFSVAAELLQQPVVSTAPGTPYLLGHAALPEEEDKDWIEIDVAAVDKEIAAEVPHSKTLFSAFLDYYLWGKGVAPLNPTVPEARDAALVAAEIKSLSENDSGQAVWDRIAGLAYHGPGLGAALAQKNGYAYTEAPPIGTEIKIPPMLRNTYSSDTSAVAYQEFMGTLIKSLYPHMITPVHHQHQHWWQKVLHVLVSIVTMVATFFLGPEVATLIATLGDLAIQGIENLTGDRHGIDWKELVTVAVSTEIGGLLGGRMPGAAALKEMGAEAAKVVLKISVENAVISAVSSQLVSLSLGLTDHFDLREVITAAATAALGAKLGGVSMTGEYALDAAITQLNEDVLSAFISGRPLDLTQTLCDMVQASEMSSVQHQQQEKAAKAKTTAPNKTNAYSAKEIKHAVEKQVVSDGMCHAEQVRSSAGASSSAATKNDIHNKKAAVANAGAKAKDFSQPPSQSDLTWDDVNFMANRNEGMSSSNSANSNQFVKPTPVPRLIDSMALGMEQGIADLGPSYGLQQAYQGLNDALIGTVTHFPQAMLGIGKWLSNAAQSIGHNDMGTVAGDIGLRSQGIDPIDPLIYTISPDEQYGLNLAGYAMSLFPAGVAVKSEMMLGAGAARWGADLSAAGKYSVQYRTARMLEKNVGYNVSPETWFNKFDNIGVLDTYVTDYRAVGEILGPVRANTQFEVGLFSRGNKLSYFKVRQLERALGLDPRTLTDGFRLSRVPSLFERSVRSPLGGNDFFTNPGVGLPGGGPELTIDPVSIDPWPPRRIKP